MGTDEDDLALIARLSDEIEPQIEQRSNPYAGSRFEWIWPHSPAKKSQIATRIVRLWAERAGFETAERINRDHALRVNGRKIVVKLSMLWSGTSLRFQQLKDQDYEYVCLLALEPHAVRLWVVPKGEALRKGASQHAGGNDTTWIRFKADSPPPWLSSYGGSLEEARSLLEQAGDASE